MDLPTLVPFLVLSYNHRVWVGLPHTHLTQIKITHKAVKARLPNTQPGLVAGKVITSEGEAKLLGPDLQFPLAVLTPGQDRGQALDSLAILVSTGAPVMVPAGVGHSSLAEVAGLVKLCRGRVIPTIDTVRVKIRVH